MGTLIGHVAPGFGFFLIGIWHLFNHTKLFAVNANKYRSLPWFPAAFHRHVELYLIMLGSAASVAMELIIGPDRHTPFDPDGTIPSNHLHNFEHSSISLLFFVYALSALALDSLPLTRLHAPSAGTDKILQLVAAMAFAQQLLLFHLHSADHMGVEGQYHWLLQLVIAASLATTLLGIAWPESFTVSYARSLSILFQGAWLMLMGYMLWTPSLIPKGCSLKLEEGHDVVRCEGSESLHRAKSLVNIEFSWFLIGLAVFAVSFYLVMMWVYANDVDYLEVGQLDDIEDVEAQRIGKFVVETRRFEHFQKSNSVAVIDHGGGSYEEYSYCKEVRSYPSRSTESI